LLPVGLAFLAGHLQTPVRYDTGCSLAAIIQVE